MDVIALLRSKNRCLERYLALSAHFLVSADRGEFDGLEQFQLRRDSLLRGIDLFDRKITEAIALMPAESRGQELAQAIEPLLAAKESLVNRILDTDERILARIRDESARVLAQVHQSAQSGDKISRFKSGWIQENGEKLDETL